MVQEKEAGPEPEPGPERTAGDGAGVILCDHCCDALYGMVQ